MMERGLVRVRDPADIDEVLMVFEVRVVKEALLEVRFEMVALVKLALVIVALEMVAFVELRLVEVRVGAEMVWFEVILPVALMVD